MEEEWRDVAGYETERANENAWATLGVCGLATCKSRRLVVQ